MHERGSDRWEAAIAATWDRVRLAWKTIAYGIDGSGNKQPLKVNADGEIDVNVIAAGIVDANNSSTTTLIADEVFTGSATEVTGYAAVGVVVFSDVDSAADGISIQLSTDGTNWDDTFVFQFETAYGNARHFRIPVTARYCRVVYTNGGTGQGVFRLQTILHTTSPPPSVHALDDNEDPNLDAGIIKSALIAQVNGSGDFIPIQANAGGILKVGGAVELDAGTNSIGSVSLDSDPAVFYEGNVTAASLSSDHTWTQLVSNVSSIASSHYEISNWSDKWLEIAFNDSPNSSAGIDIDMLITPWTVKRVPLENDLTLATDIYVRRFEGTPTLGYVSGSIIHDGGV